MEEVRAEFLWSADSEGPRWGGGDAPLIPASCGNYWLHPLVY